MTEPSQKSYFELTRGKIDPTHWTNWAADEETGAISTFIGMPRRSNGALRIVRLDYEAYEEMAHAETKAIFENLRRQYNFLHIAVIHRLGAVPLKEISILVAVSAPRRKIAFEVCRVAVDNFKQTVPVWKTEITETGGRFYIANDSRTPL